MKALCAVPLYNYGDPTRGVTIDYASFVPAIESLGYEVHFIDTWNPKAYPTYVELNAAILEAIEGLRPELFFSIQRDYEIWTETLQTIRNRGDVVMVTWTTDDSFKFDKVSRFIGPYYDAISTTYDYCIDRYRQLGVEGAVYTQWAANAHWLQEPLPSSQCKYPVSFIGTSYGGRSEIVQKLREADIAVECFGFGWPNGPVAAEAIPVIMRESRISLNFSAGFQGTKENNLQLKARTFEVPGAGGFLLTDPGYQIEKMYEIGKEIEVFQDFDDLVGKIRHYLSNSEARDRVARMGFERTRKEHTYNKRLEKVFAFAYERFRKRAGSAPVPVPVPRTSNLNLFERIARFILVRACTLIWKDRGTKAARRFTFSFSRKLFGAQTFSSKSLPGRLFPYV